MENTVEINVNNGYEPQEITVPKDQVTKLVFNRANPSACLATVQSDELGFKQALPLDQDVAVTINPKQAGEYDYSCGMGMFHGKVVVK